jgi:hypothetical protein
MGLPPGCGALQGRGLVLVLRKEDREKAMNVVYVCKTCPFTTHDKKTAEKHKNPIHQVWYWTSEIL